MNKTVEVVIDRKERRRMIPLSDVTIWRMEKAGTFPPRRQIGKRRVGWILSEVENWIKSQQIVSGE
jgi:predicted DNA-binding transcriptional regulator AlpA